MTKPTHTPTPPDTTPKCLGHTWDGWREHACQSSAKRDGYCGVHHPDRAASKRAKREAEYAKRHDDNARQNAQRASDARKLEAFPTIVAALRLACDGLAAIETIPKLNPVERKNAADIESIGRAALAKAEEA